MKNEELKKKLRNFKRELKVRIFNFFTFTFNKKFLTIFLRHRHKNIPQSTLNNSSQFLPPFKCHLDMSDKILPWMHCSLTLDRMPRLTIYLIFFLSSVNGSSSSFHLHIIFLLILSRGFLWLRIQWKRDKVALTR